MSIMAWASLFLMVIWASTTLPASDSTHPPTPYRCNATGCTIHNAYGVWGDRKNCHAAIISYPKTEEEIRLAVAYANHNGLKVKVVTKFSHTIPKLACPSDRDLSMIISTELHSSTVVVDAENLAVTADSGVALRDLIDTVEAAGLSLVAAPYWEGVTVGGLICTGSHGSSWWGRGGAVHDHVIGINLVVPANQSQGYAKIIRLEGRDELLNAAKVSLGVLGVLSKVTFSVERAFKRSISYDFTDDGDIENEYISHAKKNEFGDITWYPSRQIAAYRYDNRVPINATAGDGVFDFLGFQSQSIQLTKTIRATEKAFESARNIEGKCTMASIFVRSRELFANGLKNNDLLFTGYPVVGHQGMMQTSGSCLYSPSIAPDSCAWDPTIKGLFFYETTAIFTASRFRNFILDVKKLRDISPESFCNIDIYNGFLIRFLKASDAYLGQPIDSVVIDFNYYRADDAKTPRLREDVVEEVEQMAFIKYGARPHWAKNRKLAFFGVQKKYGNFSKFVDAKRRLDPQNMFSSEWSDEILYGREGEKGDGCALEGLCVCSEDRHCSPDSGYFCSPGLVYLEARVCRYSPSSMHTCFD